ncbi:hypothetical protein NLI96_g7030 [Meripilus lineatus]|uniref:Uncharacterized protein n=1 Tax=Meripilus lineatus TaxID=2056292 RepID=A0AAD5V4P2_9APHY|nr:hypothetical protein NLI96_g7030 [Physisporinus lineatus]
MSINPLPESLTIRKRARCHNSENLELDGEAADGEKTTLESEVVRRLSVMFTTRETHDVIVVAADGGGIALALTNADDVDGGAVKADLSIGINDDVEQVEKSSDESTAVGLYPKIQNSDPLKTRIETYGLDLVAALDVAGVAATSGHSSGVSSCEGSEEEESSEESDDASEHVDRKDLCRLRKYRSTSKCLYTTRPQTQEKIARKFSGHKTNPLEYGGPKDPIFVEREGRGRMSQLLLVNTLTPEVNRLLVFIPMAQGPLMEPESVAQTPNDIQRLLNQVLEPGELTMRGHVIHEPLVLVGQKSWYR